MPSAISLKGLLARRRVTTYASQPEPGWRASRALSSFLWLGLTAVFAVLLGALGAFFPLAAIAVLMGGIVLFLALLMPKAFALLSVSVIVLSTPLQALAGPAASSADEIVIVFCFVAFTARRLLAERRVVLLPGTAWFIGFILFGLASSGVHDVPNSVLIGALFLAVKALVFAFALAQLRWTERDFRVLMKAGIVAIVFIAVTGILNAIAPVAWSMAIYHRPPLKYSFGYANIAGPFQHPSAFGRFCAILAVGALTYGLVVRRSWANAALVFLMSGLGLLSFAVKTITSLLVTCALVTIRFLRPVGIVAIVCIAPLLGSLILPPLISYVGADVNTYIVQDSARGTMTNGSFTIANNYFPFGAGFGRYGSFTASEVYSPEYRAMRFPAIYGLGPGENGMFLNDTQWPSIIGEAGWLGTACFAAGLICIFIAILRRSSTTETKLARWIRFLAVGWLVVLLIESVAGPVFTSAPSYPFAFAAAGVVASLRDAGLREQGNGPKDSMLEGRVLRNRW